MVKHVTVWCSEDVAERFHNAVVTGRRLPPVRVQGYFNLWPPMVRQAWERYPDEDRKLHFPPDPADVDRMLEAMGWIQCLEVESRHLVWMRADNYDWNEIGRRFGCCRSTAWRRWKVAIGIVVDRLNGPIAVESEQVGHAGQ